MKQALFLASILAFGSTNIAHAQLTIDDEFLSVPIDYIASIGELDITCPNKPRKNESAPASTEEAIVTYTTPGTNSSVSADKVILVSVDILSKKWFGVIDKSNSDVIFQSHEAKTFVEEPTEPGWRTAELNSLLVVGTWTDGIIHGKLHVQFFESSWLENVTTCTGEASLLMKPK